MLKTESQCLPPSLTQPPSVFPNSLTLNKLLPSYSVLQNLDSFHFLIPHQLPEKILITLFCYHLESLIITELSPELLQSFLTGLFLPWVLWSVAIIAIRRFQLKYKLGIYTPSSIFSLFGRRLYQDLQSLLQPRCLLPPGPLLPLSYLFFSSTYLYSFTSEYTVLNAVPQTAQVCSHLKAFTLALPLLQIFFPHISSCFAP